MTHFEGAIPTKAYAGDAGYDLRAAESFIIRPGDVVLVPTGTRVTMTDPGLYAMVCSRSGLVAKRALAVANAPGIIDSGYRGEIMVAMSNIGREWQAVEAGTRIAQLVFGRHDVVTIDSVLTQSDRARGEGGHGSSGEA